MEGVLDRGAQAGGQCRSESLAKTGYQLLRQGLWQDAEAKFRAALAVDPSQFDALHNLGIVLLQRGEAEKALTHLHRAMALRPQVAQTHNNIAAALRALHRDEEALAHYRMSAALRPEHITALQELVALLLEANRPGEAAAVLEEAIARRPDNAYAHHALADLLCGMGRPEEAKGPLQRALELEPGNGQHYYLLAGLKCFEPGDPDIAAMEALQRGGRHERPEDEAALGFALAKAYRDIGENERAFDALVGANRLLRRTFPYDERETLATFARMKAIFTPEAMRAKAGLGEVSAAPIFVLGMPRSGTTLVERILASHPAVGAAGETLAFVESAQHLLPHLSEGVAGLGARGLRRAGADYLMRMRRLTGGAERFTDKQLTNVAFAGLIHLALPNARFVHVVRDPVDTCLSCFATKFSDAMRFTRDLGELGRYYRATEDLMAHWHDALAPGAILRVRYEELVDDLEGQTRRMLAHCGLDWDAACLAFHTLEGLVRTASALQVRQPVYRSSVGRWRPAAARLRPLLAGLGQGD